MFKRIVSLAIVTLLCMVSVVGCGSKEKPAKTSPESKGEAVVAENKNEKVELSFTHFYVKERKEAGILAFWDAMERFEAKYPNVTVNHEVLGHDTYEMKIKTLAAGNELPDLYSVKGSMAQVFANSGSIASIDTYLENDKQWKDGFVDGAFDNFTVNGQVYGVPDSSSTTSLIYYNRQIFKEVGLDTFPATWEEFETAIQLLKDSGYTPISVGNKGKWLLESCLLSTLGDRYTGTDWFKNLGQGSKFTDPEFVSALAALQDLASIGAFNDDINSIDNMQQKIPYFNGEAAMFIEGAWAINAVLQDAPEDILNATGVAVVPSVDGGKGNPIAVSGGAGWAFAMSSELDGTKADMAAELLKMLSDAEYSKVIAQNNYFPASKPAEFDESQLAPLTAEALELLGKSAFTPIYDIALQPNVIEVMNSGLQELVIHAVTPEELAEAIQSEFEK